MQTETPTAPEDLGLSMFEDADPDARHLEQEMPEILVFDTDSKRMGDYGGFFLAEDCGAANFFVPDAPEDPKFRERVNGPQNRIPGIHLPQLVHFALVADGPLFTVQETADGTTKEAFHFEAIVFCREVIDRRTKGNALLKLTAKGPVAVKLHHFMTIGVGEPIRRITEHYHSVAKRLYQNDKISRERYQHILNTEATAQTFWMPIQIQRGVQIGRDAQKSVTGAMVYTDEPDGPKKFKSRWPTVETGRLITPDPEGGLLLTGPIQQFCKENRARYKEALIARALFKAQIQKQEPEQEASTDDRMRRLTEIRQALRAVGKKETEQDVIKRMEEFGSSNLPGMSDIQLEEFSKYIRQFADRRAASQTSGQQAASRAA